MHQQNFKFCCLFHFNITDIFRNSFENNITIATGSACLYKNAIKSWCAIKIINNGMHTRNSVVYKATIIIADQVKI